MKNSKILNYFYIFGFVFVIFYILFLILAPQSALAQPQMDQGLNEFLQETQMPTTPLPIVIGRIVRIVLGFLGLIAVIIVIYGGFTWMTSGGAPDKIDKAKKIMIAGLIGLAIIVFAYAIVAFIMRMLGQVTGPGGPGGPVCTPGQCLGCHWICKSDGTGGEPTSGCEDLCGGLPQCPCPPGTLPYITGSLPACQLSPSSGPSGTYVTIRGCRFGSYQEGVSKVYFNDIEAEIVLCQGQPSWSETKIVVKVPEVTNDGEHQVKVVNSVGQSNTKPFTVIEGTLSPSIACVVPSYAKEGESVKVFGERFGQSGTLTFNNVTASPSVWSDNLIETPVPQNAFSGDVVVMTDQPSNGYPFYVICGLAGDCASNCCRNSECRPSQECACAQSEESCQTLSCCSGLSCCPDKKCRADCNVDGDCVYPGGTCPTGYTCCPDNICKISCGGNNPGQSCKMPDNTCGPDTICSPYQCISSVTSSPPVTECRCCCKNNSGCPAGLECELNETCYQDNLHNIKGLCCGCTQNSQCGINNLCRTTTPRCCVGCQGQSNGTKCYVPGLPNNEGECCDGVCCHGYCLNGQCLTTCGNNQLEDNELCDSTASPMFREGQDTCQEVDPKYVGGTLDCNPNCTFNTSGCFESGQAGGIGELCVKEGVCSVGASSCQNPNTYSCRVEGSDCRCCCDPTNNKCPNNLTCTADKTPCTGTGRGLCCGCKDDSQCGPHNVCDDDSCCYYLPPPNDISFEANPSQIKIIWTYSKDKFKYVTTFEIERAEKTNGNCGQYLKIAEDKKCQETPENFECFYIDKGNFAGKKFCYQIRARHGNQTAYSEYKKGEIEVQAGQVGCKANYPDGCSTKSPCCRKDTKQCVTWEFCEGKCDENAYCKPPAVKYAEADFMVTTGPIGACLISVINNKVGSPNFGQSKGYWLDDIKATGKRFGSQGGNDHLVFEENKNASVSSWQDTQILAYVPANSKFDNNLVIVRKSGLPDSNAISFKVLKRESGPGEKCYNDNSCPLDIGVCWNPPNQNIFDCKVSTSNDCYCCCTPGSNPDLCKNISQRLECKVNQTPCTGNNRGLCCGCEKDEHCGAEMGCGMSEPTPKCCYLRPSWESTSYCDNIGSPNVRLNTNITLKFNQKMDFNSLNNDNLKISYSGDCSSNEEGQTIGGRCYLNGTISSYNSLEGNTTTTKTVFSPKICRLKPNTEYQIEIVVGQDGQGVRSEKGVSMGVSQSTFSCNWNSDEKCMSQTFTTVSQETLCSIEWIDVQPRWQIVRETNQSVSYFGFARDSSDQSVCVTGFVWSSSDTSVATVAANSQDPRIGNATSTGPGEAIVIASASGKVCVQSPENERTCGKIKVDLGGPKVVEQQSCAVCSQGGQSPSPWKNSINACLNAQIVAKFDREINIGTLNSTNIKVRQCAGNDFNNPGCNDGQDVGGDITPFEEGFYFKPSANLTANKIYQVTLKSGPNGIKDTNGFQLDGNRNNLQDGSPADDYVWYFKTSSSNCSLDKVCLNPNQAKITHPNSQVFNGEVYTSNCNYLSANQFSWNWERVKIEPWEPNNVASLTPNNWQAISTSVGLGEVYIKATTENKSDQAHLIVATYPEVEEGYQPTGQNVCRNALIVAMFNQEMDQSTLNETTILLYKKVGGSGTQPIIKLFEKIKNWLVKVVRAQEMKFLIEEILPIEEKPGLGGLPPRPPVMQPVPGVVSSFNIKEGNLTKTKVVFTPTQILDADTEYQIIIKSGVKSKYGLNMKNDKTWSFKTGQEICKIEKVEIDPKNHTFTKNGEKKNFEAMAYAKNGQPISPVPGSYTWTWTWKSSDDSIVTVTDNNNNPSTGTATAKNKNGFADIIVTATDSDNKEFSDRARIRVFLCENPWIYENNNYNFELSYCRDANPLLPELKPPAQGPISGDLKLNLLFNVTGKPDVVGLQVYNNFDHLTPFKWYQKNVPNPGSPGSVIVDGYSAIQEGRTVYVGAANLASDNKLYSNIYLISYSDGASTETINIVNQIIKNWQFNTNKDSNNQYLIDSKDKAKIQRDLTRIYHFNEMAPVFESYKKQKGYYPKLESGTYIIGMTASRWPSWQQTLGQELGQPLPIDPINKFADVNCADCPKANPQCDGTCYNPAPNKKKYECLNGSQVYQYIVENDGDNYSLYSKFEYSSPSIWEHNCGSYTTQNTCLTHHWCQWYDYGMPRCRAKNLNYSDNPCSSPSTCQCFNMKYQPAQVSAPPPP